MSSRDVTALVLRADVRSVCVIAVSRSRGCGPHHRAALRGARISRRVLGALGATGYWGSVPLDSLVERHPVLRLSSPVPEEGGPIRG